MHQLALYVNPASLIDLHDNPVFASWRQGKYLHLAWNLQGIADIVEACKMVLISGIRLRD
jgi:hypothetical protein